MIGEEDEGVDQEDVEGDPDFRQTMLERTRTLRPRGLSDSSIHSTFLATSVNRLVTPAGLALSPPERTSATGENSFGAFDRQSVMRALSKKVQSFTTGYHDPSTPPTASMDGEVISPSTIPSIQPLPPSRPIPNKSLAALRRSESEGREALESSESGSFVSKFIPSLVAWASNEELQGGGSEEYDPMGATLARDVVSPRHWDRSDGRERG